MLDELESRGWSQKDLADVLDRPSQVINEIIRGTKQITPETSIQLGQALGMTPEFWLNLESAYRLRRALEREEQPEVGRRRRLYELVPLGELIRRRWIPDLPLLEDLERAVCQFLGIQDLDEKPRIRVAKLRTTETRSPESRSKVAWLKRAEALATQEPAGKFDSKRLRAATTQLFDLATSPDNLAKVEPFLREHGIRLVFVPHLPKTYVDGATFWLDDGGPVIVLSLRLGRLDSFWFTLGHELGHALDQARTGVLDDEHDVARSREAEKVVDRMAQAWLLDPKAFKTFVEETGGHPDRSEIVAFAASQRRHPSIVLGRLQYEGLLTWAQYRDMHVDARSVLQPWLDRAHPPTIGAQAPS